MRLLTLMKDGGPLSRVWGFFVIEIKCLLSVVLLHFHPGSREAYHTHAFHAVSWLLSGKLVEQHRDGHVCTYTPSFWPIITLRSTFHRVSSEGHSWAITFRGPWIPFWKEYLPASNQLITLTHGRQLVPGPA